MSEVKKTAIPTVLVNPEYFAELVKKAEAHDNDDTIYTQIQMDELKTKVEELTKQRDQALEIAEKLKAKAEKFDKLTRFLIGGKSDAESKS